MEYLPKRRWGTLEKKRDNIMIKAIDKQLKERRMMRSLEKFVGEKRFNATAGNPVKETLLKLNLPDHKSILTDSKEYIKMDMEVPGSNRLTRFIATCSYSIDIYKDIMKAQKGTKNMAADHLSILENPDLETLNEDAIRDSFPDEHLLAVQVREMAEDPWHADYVNFLVSKIIPHGLTYHLRKKFLLDIKHYIWNDPYLFNSCPDEIIRGCAFGKELQEILEHCHT
uniref:Reverse transcriptase n=1 Tax=Tanacetum cinerariifolium TaxID=118510 RepID=A0A6L2NGM6_TANCI|nr:reverse transcriptase [Tanacetum cinerariifolium]